MITLDLIQRCAINPVKADNARSVIAGLASHGLSMGMNRPHRLAQYLAQLMHESLDFRHDREIWGDTPAQKRYDTRADLGNTPARDGDGKLFMGRSGIQITGRANVRAFRDWCRKFVDANAPDFEKSPDLINTDPWEGLGPLWYWDTRKLNAYADDGNAEMITRRINGGLNGYEDRLTRLTRCSLVLLGYGPAEVKPFQRAARLLADGAAGPKTRAEMHRRLVLLPPIANPALLQKAA